MRIKKNDASILYNLRIDECVLFQATDWRDWIFDGEYILIGTL